MTLDSRLGHMRDADGPSDIMGLAQLTKSDIKSLDTTSHVSDE